MASSWFFVPNLIGYLRLILLVLGARHALTAPTTFLGYFAASICLDFFDGYFARKLNQCSKLGKSDASEHCGVLTRFNWPRSRRNS